MTVSTLYSEWSDGYLISDHATYANARSGSGATISADASDSMFAIGQTVWDGTSQCYLGYVDFDTSVVDTDTISAAEFALYPNYTNNTESWDIRVYAYDFGTGLTSADWVPGDTLSGMTLLCHFSVNTTNWSGAAYKTFTNDGTALISAINKTGHTRLVIASSRMVAGTAPSDAEYIEAQSYNGTNKPRLTITHAAGSVSFNAEVSTGTGAAQTASVKISPRATGIGAGTGAAQTPSTKVSPRATGIGAGTGAAYAVTAKIKASAGSAAGTGTAYNVTAKITVNAGSAAGTGTTADAHAGVGATASTATATGAAAAPSPRIAASAGSASGTGASGDGSIRYDIEATAECAQGSGEAHQPAVYLGALTVTLADSPSASTTPSDALYGTTAVSDSSVGSVTTSEA